MDWDGLFDLFTKEVDSSVRNQVLGMIASSTPIGHSSFYSSGGGCIFLMAAYEAGYNEEQRIRNTNQLKIAISNCLGISNDSVQFGIRVWDGGTDEDRRIFRDRIRQYLDAFRAVRQMEFEAQTLYVTKRAPETV